MSMNKTPLGLNNWTLSEKPLMEEFNSDNQIIDTKLRELADNTVKAVAWTAEIRDTDGNVPEYTSSGTMTIVGNMALLSGTIQLTKNTMTGQNRITNLPIHGADYRIIANVICFNIGLPAGYTQFVIHAVDGNTNLRLEATGPSKDLCRMNGNYFTDNTVIDFHVMMTIKQRVY